AWNEDERAYNRDQDAKTWTWREDERDYNRAWNEDERAYNRSQDAKTWAWNQDERDYSRGRDAVGDRRYDDATTYSRSQDALDRQERQDRYAVSDAQTALSNQRTANNDRAALGWQALNAGMVPDQETLAVMGVDPNEASLYASGIRNTQAAQAAKASSGASGESKAAQMSLSTAKGLADEEHWSDAVYETLLREGYTEQDIQNAYGEDDGFKSYIRTRNAASGPGLRTFESQYNRIAGYLKDGKEKDAATTINAIYSSLNERQRLRLNALLDSYGYQSVGG
ncbi:MAG: hypothetical protein IJT94_12980, partial [Oscillibacter sp.]|nr:hypothetical protein [Oscillibacter sp.]